MQNSQLPVKFPIPFAKNAGGGFIRAIPQASQIGITNGAASLNDGFPPATFQPTGSGGTPPWGQDYNGILNQITAWNQWQQAGASVQFDQTFSNAIGGYPNGAILQSSANAQIFWLNIADNNTTNPDGGSPSNWVAWGPAGILAPLVHAVTAASATLAIDYSLGSNVNLTLSATVTTFTVSNWPTTGKLGRLYIELTSTGAFNITGWPGTTRWAGGTAPTITSGAGKRDTIILTSSDGGATFRGYVVSQNMS